MTDQFGDGLLACPAVASAFIDTAMGHTQTRHRFPVVAKEFAKHLGREEFGIIVQDAL